MKNDGAFPADAMSLRDWFAGMALQGMCASAANGVHITSTMPIVAQAAFAYADAMLAEREKEKTA